MFSSLARPEANSRRRGSTRFLYVYFMRDAPDGVRAAAPRHAAYWRDLGLPDYVGGPFADRSRGSITFTAGSPREAERLVADDPFLLEGLIERHRMKGGPPNGRDT